MTVIATDNVHGEWYADVPRSVRGFVIFGFLLMTTSMGGFGYWAFNAPLAAAVIAQGSFVATGSNKIIQHLEGGIIDQIMIKEGDFVNAGDTLLFLDETASLANERELFLRQMRLIATEARLLAEASAQDELRFPDVLLASRIDHEVATIIESQVTSFLVSQSTLRNNVSILRQNIEALTIRSGGYVQQLVSLKLQAEILQEEFEAKTTLLESGLVRRTELNTVRHAIAETDGKVARLEAEINEVREVKERYETEIENALGRSKQAAIDELSTIQAELDSIREQLRTASSVRARSEIRSPVSGTIVRLHYHTAGGVIESGRAIAEILPSDEPLIIEVQIPRTEIDTINTGLVSTVRLTALNQRTTPVLFGEVYYVSADSITERSAEGPDAEVYVARISIQPQELLRVPGFSPTPGMPAEIMIQTAERTFVDYITKPIRDSMIRAFREQ
ncbi:HlyD family type I secretion periplasmic adaptor subunit [Sulfitobacter sp. SK012]|uniref:HlyD family type I secretion periplasmic adaptor subunit n=1 Tax=Sulfitobacter sp. SK012 TaxID=1389005 RepID=UPI000E0CB374|nr:HlyD family type I secretion periplasmic adaptor subunit [Sulfitobacter sp. SK012]AXI45668.1 HlyD family type I secretion periplasmic adaptor subunit [Sulfitobacter sp. SK012]